MNPRVQNTLTVGLGLLLLSNSVTVTTTTTAATLTALGVLNSPDPSSFATGVTPDGRYVIGYAKSGSGTEAFRWSQAEGMIGLGDLPGGDFRSEASGISDDGSLVVGTAFSDFGLGFEPFRWTKAGGLTRLDGRLPAGFVGAGVGVGGVTPDGLVVVGSCGLASGEFGAYRWTAQDGYKLLAPPSGGGISPTAVAVSADGQTVAGFLEPISFSFEGFRWTASSGMVGIGRQLGGKPVQSEVYAMSADGRFLTGLVVREETGTLEMMRWSAEQGMELLGHFPKGERRGIGWGMSNDGRMVVGEAAMEVVSPGIPFPVVLPRAVVWREGSGLKPLWDLLIEQGIDPSSDGWEYLYIARAVSDDGRFVVGAGRRNGRNEAFLADLSLKLEFTRTEDRLVLTWPAGFTLQRTDSLSPENWTDLPNAASPFEVDNEQQHGFFRITSGSVAAPRQSAAN